MARSTRDARLETRAARSRLPAVGRRFHIRSINKGLALAYRREKGPAGSWYVRLFVDGKYRIKLLGIADDTQDADGSRVFDFFQAQDRARQFAEAAASEDLAPPAVYTVGDVMADYQAWFRGHRKSVRDTESVINAHILPAFGSLPVAELTTAKLRRWHHQLATQPKQIRGKRVEVDPTDENAMRARKATANRILTVLKAAINFAWTERGIGNPDEWRRVKPFREVDAPRVRYLSTDEAVRLINACTPDLRELVTGALLTGCRYGELARMVCGDYSPDGGTVRVPISKSGKARHVPLTDEGRAFFERLAAGRPAGERMFLRENGVYWGKADQARPLADACKRAGIVPAVSFHILRHTYGALLAMQGVPLQVIAVALGHADTRMTERHYAHLQPDYVAVTIRQNLPSFGLRRDNVVPLREIRPDH